MLDLQADPDQAATASVERSHQWRARRLRAHGARFAGRILVPARKHAGFHSVWRGSYGSIVTAIVRLPDGRISGAYAVTGGIG